MPPEEKPPIEIDHPEWWRAVIEPMREVNHGRQGTARNAFADAPYVSAGKTGTAQVYTVGQEEKYDKENVADHLRDNAMYIGFAPYQNPEVVVSVVLENAGGGGSMAAPIARAMMDSHLLNPLPMELATQ